MIKVEDRYYLPHSSTCFLCGEENDIGLKCRFFADSKGEVHLYNVIKKDYCGYLDVIHGGVQSAMLDETMGWCGFTQTESEVFYFTREISVKFRRNVTSGVPIFIDTKLVDVKRGMVYTEGAIRDEAGNILTTATGIFVPIPKEKMEETSDNLRFIDDGRRYLEKAIRVCKPKLSKRPSEILI